MASKPQIKEYKKANHVTRNFTNANPNFSSIATTTTITILPSS
jgi:hypothetical protein